MKRGLAIGIMVAIAVVVGVAAFFGGRALGGGGTPSPQEAMKVIQNLTQEQRAQLAQSGGGFFGSRTGTSGTGTRAGGGFTSGSVISKDASSLTVKDSSGNTKTIYFASSTTFSKTSDVTDNDLAVGDDVTVTGTSNSDGSVTASRVIIGTLTGGPGQGGVPGGSSGSESTGTTGANGAGAGSAPAGGAPSGAAPSGAAPSGSTPASSN